jgi:hypothetical protein
MKSGFKIKDKMKPLLLTLILSLSLAGFGQIKIDTTTITPETFIKSSEAFWVCDSTVFIHRPIYDTVAVWLECADTTKIISNNMTVKGYEVRKSAGNEWISTGSDLMAVLTPIYTHVSYLDHFKKPLNRLVWGTKRREK